jgi:hypothetical protein
MSSAIEQAEALLHHAQEHAVPRTQAKALPTWFEWFFVITGGLVVFLPFILWIGEQELNQENLVHWYFWLSVIISSPHVYATYVRLQRKIDEKKVGFWLGFPLYAAIGGLLTLLHGNGYFVITITLVNVWQSFHYLRQTYGVSCLYGTQQVFDETDRSLRWWAYHLIFPYLIIGRWDTLYDAWGGRTYELMPVDFGPTAMRVLFVIAGLGVYTQIVSEIRLIIKNGKNYSPIGLICFLICIGVHYYGFMVLSHFQRGFETITFFHALQYLALVWVLERKQRAAAGNRWITMLPNLAGFALFWLALYLLGFGWEQYITTGLEKWWLLASTILLSSISVHHYIVDSFIWRRTIGA